MSRRPEKGRPWPPPKGPPIVPPKGAPITPSRGVPSRVRSRLPPQARAKMSMVKGRYRIVAGNKVIELNEIPVKVMSLEDKRVD